MTDIRIVEGVSWRDTFNINSNYFNGWLIQELLKVSLEETSLI